MPFQPTGLIICQILFRNIFPVVFILSPDRELFQMPEEAWGAQDSLLTHTDAEVLGKPMAHLSKVMIDNHCNNGLFAAR